MTSIVALISFIVFVGAGVLASRCAEVGSAVDAWLANQAKVQTWSADFLQVRTLKALAQPLTAQGHVWFAAPNRFRWELGRPPETIALRQTNQMLVVYPKLARVERYPLEGGAGPWKDALSLLEAGFPRNRADLEAKFRIRSQAVTNEVLTLSLEPKSSAARRMMPLLKVAFGTNDLSLRSTELQFADGSSLRNIFTNAQVNVPVDSTLFDPVLSREYKIVEPLKSR